MDKNLYQEIWKDIEGYEGLYQVSNFGRVKSLYFGKEKILKQSKHKDEYLQVSLSRNGKKKTFTIHKLVALAFIPNPDNLLEVNHKDENKQNNHIENLEFCNHTYNINYGTCKKRISKAHKGKKHLEETKQKLRKPKSEEHKQKIRKAQKGKPNYKRRKPIQQYTKDNVFIKEWDSAKSVSKELNIYASAITSCCRGTINSAYGFIWKYKI